MEQVRAHDRRMDERKPEWEQIKALWRSAWWKWIRGHAKNKTWGTNFWDVRGDIEVNRMWPFLHGYQQQLYHEPGTPIVTPDPFSPGDPRAVRAVLTRFLKSRGTHDRFLTAFRQGLMFDGVGAKVGYSPGTAPAYDRVFMRVIPFWELLLDQDVTDPDDARFRGHIFHRPKADVEAEFGLKGLKGTRRRDFLSEAEWGEGVKDSRDKDAPKDSDAASDQSNYVRVLEFINMVDTFTDEEGLEYQGRFEIYVLDQGEILREDGTTVKKYHPIESMPLPFADEEGRPEPHIIPLIFNPEPEHPLRGIPHATRIKSQCVELNLLRTAASSSSKKDARQFTYRKGTLSSEGEALIQEGIDGALIPVTDPDVPLDSVVVPIKNSPVSMNILEAARAAERDLDIAAGQSPNARGVVTKATAEEIQQVARYTEGDFGYHAQRRDEFREQICQLVIRAMVAAMQDAGDYAGAFDQEDVDLFAVGADRVANEEDQKELKELAEDALDSYENPEEQSLETGEESGEADKAAQAEAFDFADLFGDLAPALDADTVSVDEENVHVQEGYVIVDGPDTIEVTVESLNGRFYISFSDEGITPSDAVDQQRNLIGIMEQYMGLWAAYQKGSSADKVMALAYMEAIHARFRMPDSLSPKNLIAQVEAEEGQKKPKKPKKGEEDFAGEEPPPQPQDELAQLRQMAVEAPRQALDQMRQLMPDMRELEQFAQLDDEQLSQALVAVVDQMAQPAPQPMM